MTRYDEIRTRCEAATNTGTGKHEAASRSNRVCLLCESVKAARMLAREDVPYLLREIERYRGELQRIVSIGTSLKGERSAAAEIAAEALAVKS